MSDKSSSKEEIMGKRSQRMSDEDYLAVMQQVKKQILQKLDHEMQDYLERERMAARSLGQPTSEEGIKAKNRFLQGMAKAREVVVEVG